jgi:Glutaredoxin
MCLLAITCHHCIEAFRASIPCTVRAGRLIPAMATSPFPNLDDRTYTKIDDLVKSNKVLLFMKGNKLFPQCGFSNTACRILDALNTPYETVNVLDDGAIRNGVKVYSSCKSPLYHQP